VGTPGAAEKSDLAPPPIEALAAGLKSVLRKGLPIVPDAAPSVLLELRGVRARAVDSSDFLGRVKALNALLQTLLLALGESEEAQALQILFALRASDRGTTLTARRSRASAVGEWQYDDTHFRKHIEPRLVRDLAWFLHEDSQNYTPRTKYAPNPTEISGDTPSLGPDDISEQEEQVSRLWALVYELRAELIRRTRLAAGEQKDSNALAEAEDSCLWTVARLLVAIHEYLETFGDRIMHGDAEFNAEGLIRLAGWTGSLDVTQSRALRLAVARAGGDREAFLRLQTKRR
jgi:hypothetical protein